MCKALSKEVGPRGIRVNTISPGPVATDLWLGHQGVATILAHASGVDPGAVAEKAARQSVTGRFTGPTRSPSSSWSLLATVPRRTSPVPTS